MEELIEYTVMEGLEIVGLEGERRVMITLFPGKEKLIKLRNIQESKVERKLQSKIIKNKIYEYVEAII